jgi:ribose 5-phosphate isomerase B
MLKKDACFRFSISLDNNSKCDTEGPECLLFFDSRNHHCRRAVDGQEDKTMKPVAIGCDPNAAELKDIIKAHLDGLGYEWQDYGSEDPVYANVAIDVAEAVAAGKHDRGILICGTGIGVSLAANKVPGAYAALCADAYSTERSRKSNNVNIMTLGSQVTGPELAKTLVTVWMNAEYTPGGRSEPKIQRIYEYARQHHTVT